MVKKTVHPHLFATSDPERRGDKYAIRSCDVCSLPESRLDVHTLPATSDEARARDDAVLGEGDSK